MSDNEIHLLIKYIKSVLWRVVKHLSYIQDTWCLKVKCKGYYIHRCMTETKLCHTLRPITKSADSVHGVERVRYFCYDQQSSLWTTVQFSVSPDTVVKRGV